MAICNTLSLAGVGAIRSSTLPNYVLLGWLKVGLSLWLLVPNFSGADMLVDHQTLKSISLGCQTQQSWIL
jgi:hypothetical protein